MSRGTFRTTSSTPSTPGDTRVEIASAFNTMNVFFNERVRTLKDTRVRQALNYATDKNAIIQAVLFGKARPANSVLPPGLNHYDPAIPPHPYDLNRAKKLLAASAEKDGFKLDLLIQTGSATQEQIATILQEQWAKLGITVGIEKLEIGAIFDRWSSYDYQALLFEL